MIEGRCTCGALRYRAKGPMLWAVHCHCEDCQRASGADYVSWFGLPTAGVTWEGKRALHVSSPGVQRGFCPVCGAPMSYESEKYPGETHLYAPSLLDRSLYQPTAHIHWAERVPWLDHHAGLPRHAKGSGG